MMIYRKEIDGLRAIAVLPIIFYHAGLKTYFPGGYIGVDIFFVISGYLITSIIKTEYEVKKFSLIDFYERRCRRILPALFFMLFLSSTLAYFCMLPDQLKEYGESLISVICFSSNVYFWYKDNDYFSRLSELNPLIHTWSLAVEEQFYLIFPLLCYCLMKRKSLFISILICSSLISFIVCQWGENFQRKSFKEFQMFSQPPYASFYLPIGRIWELLIGVFAALYMKRDDTTKKFPSKSSQFLSSIGFILIIISIGFFDDHRIPTFPNLYTLVPTGGTALIILYGQKSTFVGRLLSRDILRWIGLLSYSAYLWHQPMLAFLRLYSYEILQFSTMLILLTVIFLLSIFSYFFIEQPFRNRRTCSRIKIFFIAGLTTLSFLNTGFFLIKTANHRILELDKMNGTYLFDLHKYYNDAYRAIAYTAHINKANNCSKTKSDTNRRLVIVGDSFSQDFFNTIIEEKHLINYEICLYHVYYECQIYLGIDERKNYIDGKYQQVCANDNDIKYAFPMIRLANIIILASQWRVWSAERLATTIKLLHLTNDQQLFVLGRKDFGKVDPYIFIRKSHQYRIAQYQYPSKESHQVNDILRETLDKSIFIDIQKMICTGRNQTCPLFTPNGKLISHDGAHLTKYGAIYVGQILFNNEPLNRLK